MKQFNKVAGLRPGRSVFDLSYSKKLTCDMGQLIPVMCDEVVPGDVWHIGNEIVVRMMPLVAPILHEVNVYVHYFFVPYRILWDDWEKFITGGTSGDDASVLPRWSPTVNSIGSLWDYLGLPVGVVPVDALPLDFIRRAYNKIYNEYYRDETLIEEVAETNEAILNRCWEKDYFTSALPWQQRGTAPALPISGTTHADFSSMSSSLVSLYDNVKNANTLMIQGTTGTTFNAKRSDSGNYTINDQYKVDVADAKAALTAGNTINLASATTFNVADLRLAFQIQKWLERNARAGARYTEFLQAHFGVSPRDERLQRPEYIGGSKSGVVISEVLQTSETATTPQGNLAGHGLVADRTFVAKYHCQEYGLIMGIMSIMPRSAYQQGIDRQWLRRTRYDFYSPEFANLSEQAIERAEIYASGVGAENRTIFGYQGRFDEMRVKRNMVVGQMRDTLDYWHLGRKFTSAPLLNADFVRCTPSKRIFADQADPGLLVSFGNLIRAARPMPIESDPGLIDHH